MLDPTPYKGSIQDIAIKVTEEQIKNRKMFNDSKEKTIFVLGSKSVVSSAMIFNQKLDSLLINKKKFQF